MAETRHSLVLDVEVDQGRRIELARVAARLEQEEMARAAEISVRSYQRTIAGTRPPRAGELIVWSRLTGQDLEFFGDASSDDGAAIVPQPEASVKRSGRAAA